MGTSDGTRLRLDASSIATMSRPLRGTENLACDERGTRPRNARPALMRVSTSRTAGALPGAWLMAVLRFVVFARAGVPPLPALGVGSALARKVMQQHLQSFTAGTSWRA